MEKNPRPNPRVGLDREPNFYKVTLGYKKIINRVIGGIQEKGYINVSRGYEKKKKTNLFLENFSLFS